MGKIDEHGHAYSIQTKCLVLVVLFLSVSLVHAGSGENSRKSVKSHKSRLTVHLLTPVLAGFPQLCLKDGDYEEGHCANFNCSAARNVSSTAKQPGPPTVVLSLGTHRVRVTCKDGGDDVKLSLWQETDAEVGKGHLAWNILCAAFNIVPLCLFASFAVSFYRYKLPGLFREKQELKSIFQSLGYDENGILYRKVHDFIYDY
jgi:hypothetical protein